MQNGSGRGNRYSSVTNPAGAREPLLRHSLRYRKDSVPGRIDRHADLHQIVALQECAGRRARVCLASNAVSSPIHGRPMVRRVPIRKLPQAGILRRQHRVHRIIGKTCRRTGRARGASGEAVGLSGTTRSITVAVLWSLRRECVRTTGATWPCKLNRSNKIQPRSRSREMERPLLLSSSEIFSVAASVEAEILLLCGPLDAIRPPVRLVSQSARYPRPRLRQYDTGPTV